MSSLMPAGLMPDGLTGAAPAKVNLHLHVTGRRPDGYHLLDSLVVFAGIGDRLSVTPAETLSLTVNGPFAAGLDGEADNLVLRAARLLAECCGIAPVGALVLEKNLPVASGIGGGSADAAAALRLLCRHWAVDPGQEALFALGRRLGADVPACLLGCSAVMSGIGEVLAPVGTLPEFGIVLVNPGVAISTPEVFRARTGPFSPPLARPGTGWRTGADLIAWLRAGGNDLEAPALALAPAIGAVLQRLRQDPACQLARMSGSGATCFGLFASAEQAAEAAAGIRGPGWWVWGGSLA